MDWNNHAELDMGHGVLLHGELPNYLEERRVFKVRDMGGGGGGVTLCRYGQV